MHRSRLAALVIDSKVDSIEPAQQFWSAALGLPCRHSNEAWADRYAYLETPDQHPLILIQTVEHDSRVHLDIETDDIEAEVKRLTALGAKVFKRMARWVVMEAPTGHRFCVVKPQRTDFDNATDVNCWN